MRTFVESMLAGDARDDGQKAQGVQDGECREADVEELEAEDAGAYAKLAEQYRNLQETGARIGTDSGAAYARLAAAYAEIAEQYRSLEEKGTRETVVTGSGAASDNLASQKVSVAEVGVVEAGNVGAGYASLAEPHRVLQRERRALEDRLAKVERVPGESLAGQLAAAHAQLDAESGRARELEGEAQRLKGENAELRQRLLLAHGWGKEQEGWLRLLPDSKSLCSPPQPPAEREDVNHFPALEVMQLRARVRQLEEDKAAMEAQHRAEKAELMHSIRQLDEEKASLAREMRRLVQDRNELSQQLACLSVTQAAATSTSRKVAQERYELVRRSEELRQELDSAKAEIGMLLDTKSVLEQQNFLQFMLRKWSQGLYLNC